jgi:group II intron reverse transcriptase/maturase
MQKTVENAGYPCEDKVELESSREVQSIALVDAEVGDGARDDLLERLLSRENLNAAYKRVRKDGGAAGIDGMSVEEAAPYLKEHRDEIRSRIRKGKYKPSPVRRVEMPKPDGGVRTLGVPTVVDRVIQQAIVQVLTPVFEPIFSDSSYGFRPKRSAHQAIGRAREYCDEGYGWVVDIDLEKYFDTVNHEILMDMVMMEVKERPIINP